MFYIIAALTIVNPAREELYRKLQIDFVLHYCSTDHGREQLEMINHYDCYILPKLPLY